MSRRLRAGFSILFGHVLFDLSCSCPLVRASLRILLYSGIPYSNVIYLCAKYFLLQLLPGYLHIDDLGGVDAKCYMGRPGRGRYLSPLGLAPASPPSLSHFLFSLRRLASYSNSNGRRSSSVLTACQRFNLFFWSMPLQVITCRPYSISLTSGTHGNPR
ncbi:hypothetical protein F5888DRAFT_1186974 [Russula emetica]|nr:hypothetical protein F5888DRAFT_1186974 [Russula emetica]